jgi:DNA-binding MarR family transcriptional regulator
VAAESGFDEAIHAPNRLRICGLLRPVDSVEFSVLRSTLNISEANLSKTIRSLVEAGYVRVSKSASDDRSDRRRTTSVKLTAAGRHAFDAHVIALQRMVAGVVEPTTTT